MLNEPKKWRLAMHMCESHELEQHKSVVRSVVKYLKNKKLATCKTTKKQMKC
jgi:uncharacterized protein YlxP (DUF503 family)